MVDFKQAGKWQGKYLQLAANTEVDIPFSIYENRELIQFKMILTHLFLLQILCVAWIFGV